MPTNFDVATGKLFTKPARRAGLSFQGSMRPSVFPAVLWALALCAAAAACADSDGLYARYQLEKKFFEARQAWATSQLQAESGQPAATSELDARLAAVLEEFRAARASLGPGDSVVFAYAAEAAFRLSESYTSEQLWHDAARYQELVAADSLFSPAARHRALYGWGESLERLGRFGEASVVFRRLCVSFYPPSSTDGVNLDVLRLPIRMVAMAERNLPESAAVFRAFGEAYYDSLAAVFPHTDLGYQALGELGKLYGLDGRWEDVMATLNRAVDSTGTVVPSYRIDLGEILAGQLHDTAGALRVFMEVSEALPESPFRVDADVKTAAIWFAQGRNADVQALLGATKRQFEGNPEVDVAVGLLLARSFAASGNKERARTEYSYLVTSHPRTLQAVEAALAIAGQHERDSEPSAAAEWYDRADRLAIDLINDRESSPQIQGAAMNIRASLAVQSKRWDDAAMRLSEIASAFSPGTSAGASALVRLGWLQLRERHDTLAAGQAWQVFLSVHPDHPDGTPLKTEMSKWPERFRQNESS